MNPPDEIPATAVFVLSTLYAPRLARLRTARCCASGAVPPGTALRLPEPEHPAATAPINIVSAARREIDGFGRMKTSSPGKASAAEGFPSRPDGPPKEEDKSLVTSRAAAET